MRAATHLATPRSPLSDPRPSLARCRRTWTRADRPDSLGRKPRMRMLDDRIEAKWIESFAAVFPLCGVQERGAVRHPSETQSRKLNVALAELALSALAA